MKVADQAEAQEPPRRAKLPILPGVKRLIVGNACERGLVEDVNDMRVIKQGLDAVKAANPNFAELGARAVWRSFNPPNVADPPHKLALTAAQRRRNERLKRRETLRLGIPRALNQHKKKPLDLIFFPMLDALPVLPAGAADEQFTRMAAD